MGVLEQQTLGRLREVRQEVLLSIPVIRALTGAGVPERQRAIAAAAVTELGATVRLLESVAGVEPEPVSRRRRWLRRGGR